MATPVSPCGNPAMQGTIVTAVLPAMQAYAACVESQTRRRPISPRSPPHYNKPITHSRDRHKSRSDDAGGFVARKREHLLRELATLPWWVSVIFAVVVYLGLRYVFPMVVKGGLLAPTFGKVAVAAAPWLGLLFLLPIPFSLINTYGRRRVLDTQRDLSTIRTLSWEDFERMVGEVFRRRGYAVEERGGAGPDGGVDLVLRKDGQKTIVQCKHWKAQQIGVTVVRELLGVMVAERANKGILVSSGRFTSEALEFARGKPIELMDGEALKDLVPAARKALERDLYPTWKETSGNPGACPDCGSEMVRRVAKRGMNAGRNFWGCSLYPKCRGTRPINSVAVHP
jgi:restriction system protein